MRITPAERERVRVLLEMLAYHGRAVVRNYPGDGAPEWARGIYGRKVAMREAMLKREIRVMFGIEEIKI